MVIKPHPKNLWNWAMKGRLIIVLMLCLTAHLTLGQLTAKRTSGPANVGYLEYLPPNYDVGDTVKHTGVHFSSWSGREG